MLTGPPFVNGTRNLTQAELLTLREDRFRHDALEMKHQWLIHTIDIHSPISPLLL